MEPWKIATICALLLSLFGFGLYKQSTGNAPAGDATPMTAPAPLPYVGKTLPAWQFAAWNGRPVSLAALRGQTALIEVFRTGCPHCQDAAPFMVALNARYGPRGLKMLGIQSPGDLTDARNPESDWAQVQNWLKERHIAYPVAQDAGSRYFQGTLKKQFLGGDANQLKYPTLLLMGPKGEIEWAKTGHDTEKAIALSIELEKRFPGVGDAAARATDLTRWLSAHLPELPRDANLQKALADDIAHRFTNP